MKRDTIRLPDGEVAVLRWDEAGPDAPLVHFAHATGLTAMTYRQLAERLSHRYRVVAIDQRGHGRTKLPTDPAALTSWLPFADDLAAVLERIGEPAHLVGHSMGASVSFLLAATRPEMARSVIMIDPALVPYAQAQERAAALKAGTMEAPEIARQAARRRASWASRDEVRSGYDGRGMFAFWKPGFLDDYLEDGLRDAAEGGVTLACPPAWEATVFTGATTEIWDMAPRYRGPLAILRADIGSTFSAADAEHFKSLAPQAHIAHASGLSHFVPMEAPELVERFIVDALEEAHAGAGTR